MIILFKTPLDPDAWNNSVLFFVYIGNLGM